MAIASLITPPPPTGQGFVIADKGGTTVYQSSGVTAPPSAATSAAWGRLAAAARAWNGTLTAAERADWDTQTLGFFLSTYRWQVVQRATYLHWIRAATIRDYVGRPFDSRPIFPSPGGPPNVSAIIRVMSPTTWRVEVNTAPYFDDRTAHVLVAPDVNRPPTSPLRSPTGIGIFPLAAGVPGPFIADVEAPFAATPGQRIDWQLVVWVPVQGTGRTANIDYVLLSP